MPTKGQQTRRHIVSRAATAFNLRGYAGTSIADILSATGLEKGGLYRHFSSKDELALAAFDHAVGVLRAHRDAARASARSPFERVLATIDAVAGSVRHPPVPGGCPILNTAIEADDTHAALRARAAAALRAWQRSLASDVADAVASGELRDDLEPRAVAAVLISALEGAIATTALLRDPGQMSAIAAHVRDWLGDLRPVGLTQ